jgi:hypothetical protein
VATNTRELPVLTFGVTFFDAAERAPAPCWL